MNNYKLSATVWSVVTNLSIEKRGPLPAHSMLFHKERVCTPCFNLIGPIPPIFHSFALFAFRLCGLFNAAVTQSQHNPSSYVLLGLSRFMDAHNRVHKTPNMIQMGEDTTIERDNIK